MRDPRRVKTLARTVTALFHQPQLSLSAALGSGTRQAAGDLFGHADTRVADLIAGHVASTAARCQGYARVLVAQDTTYFTYGQEQIVGLGRLNGSTRGLVGHAALAVSPDGVPLGVLALQLWGNKDTPVPGYKLQVDPEIVQCESAKWEVTLASIQEALPAGQAALVLADRESDVTDYLRAPRRPGIELLLRAVGGRKVNGAVREADPLHTDRGVLAEVVAQAPRLGLHTVAVPAQPARPGHAAQKARLASLEIRIAAVTLPAVTATEQRKEQPVVPLWAILAVEPEPPEGTLPLHWLLLTTLAVRLESDVVGPAASSGPGVRLGGGTQVTPEVRGYDPSLGARRVGGG